MVVELVLGLIGGFALAMLGFFIAFRTGVLSPIALLGGIMMIAGVMMSIFSGVLLADAVAP